MWSRWAWTFPSSTRPLSGTYSKFLQYGKFPLQQRQQQQNRNNNNKSGSCFGNFWTLSQNANKNVRNVSIWDQAGQVKGAKMPPDQNLLMVTPRRCGRGQLYSCICLKPILPQQRQLPGKSTTRSFFVSAKSF